MKTSELTGAALDWAVVRCECAMPAPLKTIPAMLNGTVRILRGDKGLYSGPVSPSTDWKYGGPIIERENISITGTDFEWWDCDSGWYAHIEDCYAHGDTPLIAAMRCYVMFKEGYEVEVPAELL